jgi:hypothetical protein
VRPRLVFSLACLPPLRGWNIQIDDTKVIRDIFAISNLKTSKPRSSYGRFAEWYVGEIFVQPDAAVSDDLSGRYHSTFGRTGDTGPNPDDLPWRQHLYPRMISSAR